MKPRKGERKVKAFGLLAKQTICYGVVATAIAPIDEGGLGLTLLDASSKIKLNFKNLPSEESLRRYWNNYKKYNRRTFKSNTD